jgi:ubiquitin-activating enzyme E1
MNTIDINVDINLKVDESQYSRQLHTFGIDAQKSLENTNVLISGLSGVGVEIAKCVIMTGVNSVTLHDNKLIDLIDLSSNYYANMSDIGKLRTDVVIQHLSE